MQRCKADSVSFSTMRCAIAYDSRTGDVLYVHEFMSEPSCAQETPWDAEAVRHAAARDFGARPLEVMSVPRGMEPKDGYMYRVDVKSKTLAQVERPQRRFRDFAAGKAKGERARG